jgi:hypothetical protein
MWWVVIYTILRLGAFYGFWVLGQDMDEPVLQAVAVFLALAEVIRLGKTLTDSEDVLKY